MPSKVERIDPKVKLPFDEEILLSGNRIKITEEQRKLVKTLQELLQKISTVANLTLDLFDGEAIYSKLKLPDGNYPIGTWRLIQVGDNWERQVQLALGVWTFAGYFGLPA